jgi:hypothetical protein
MRFAYADPPYLGQGAKWYGKHHPDAAVWDDPDTHIQLLNRLTDEYPDGWAVSLSAPSLKLYLTHAPDDVRIGAWVKTWHQFLPLTVQYAWEPVIWRGGRKDPKRNPWVRDWVMAGGGNPAHGARLVGAKPEPFNRWVADLLCYREGDELVDLFPGTGGMGAALAQGVLTFDGGAA